MKIAIFNRHSADDFKKLQADFQIDLDIYYEPEFLELEAGLIKGEYEIFTLSSIETGKFFVYPYIKILIKNMEGYFDLVSPYGYAGPYCNDSEFFKIGETEFLVYIQKQKVVSEFVRYHFIYNENCLFTQKIENEHNRTLVVFDLSYSWESLWMNNVSQNNRNYCNKFKKEGFEFTVNTEIKELELFISMYYETMQNADATKSFFFPKEYFYELFEKLPEKIMLGRITKDHVTYASVLFFVSGGIVEPYLNGRNLNHKKLPSNVPLYINLAEWAKERGLKLLNMGGGRTHLPDDSLFLFKKRLCNQFREFYIGKRIHDNNVYQDLIDKYISIHGTEKYEIVKHRLQFYQ